MSKRRRQRNRVSSEPMTTFVEQLSHDGRGIARIDGKITFIQGALANETVTFEYLRQKKDFAEGRLLSVITPASNRAKSLCDHYEACGGCSFQHLEHDSQIHEKEKWLLDLLKRTAHVTPETILTPLTSEPWNYRNKARLSVRYVQKKQATLIGFREKNNPRFITDIKRCPILNAKVDKNLLSLRQLLDSFSNPAIIAQIEVAAGDEEVALIFRNLEPLGDEDEAMLREFADKHQFTIYLQPAGPDSVYLFHPEHHHPYLSYKLPEQNIHYSFYPTDFTQINSKLNRAMIERALDLLKLNANDKVLDLFCGLGNFSLPIAKYAHWVTGVEGSDDMVKRASMNAQLNDINNADFFCANLEDENALDSYKNQSYNKILLDPPRTGAQAIVSQIHKINPKLVVYISCNPATLARDSDILIHQKGYRMTSAGVMDMFPHTSHVESIAVFEKDG